MGKPWSTSWFRLRGAVPEEWSGRRVEVVVDPGFTGQGPGFQAEGMLYDHQGVPLKGVHPRNRHLALAHPAAGGEPVDLLLEAAANPAVLEHGFAPTPLGDVLTAGDRPLYRFASADLAVLDEEVWHLVLDIEVLSELMHELPDDRSRRHEILRALESMLDALDLHDVSGTAAAAGRRWPRCWRGPHPRARTGSRRPGTRTSTRRGCGRCARAVRKASRTFANATALARDYPELVFACSQAQQYAWVKEHQPHIWERIKEAVAAGQWSPVGSMWVESDANMPGASAGPPARPREEVLRGGAGRRDGGDLAAGLLRLHRRLPPTGETGGGEVVPHPEAVLEPAQQDAAPHLLVGGHRRHRVFTHFPPVDTYNAQLHARQLAHAEKNFADKGRATRSLVPFGWGDGGGGPTREMLERPAGCGIWRARRA